MLASLLTLSLGQDEVLDNPVLDRLRAKNPDSALDRAKEQAELSKGLTVADLELPGNPCGGGMYIMNVLPTMNDQVMGISGDWMQGCQTCATFLETYHVNGFCTGWYCEIGYFGPIATGVWLHRNGQACPVTPGPAPPPQPACQPLKEVNARWVPIASTSEQISYKVAKGVTRATTSEDSYEWGAAVEAKVSAGFQVPTIGGVSVDISASVSASFGNTYTEYFQSTESTEFTFTANRAGVMWQWQFNVYDACGMNIVKGMDVVLTENQAEPPCCLPGHFTDPSKPEEANCVATWGETAVYNLCKKTAEFVQA